MRFQTLAIPVSIVLLAAFVGVMGRALWLELQSLSTAGNENSQWSILQLDTEFANLQSTLVEQGARSDIDKTIIRLRTDIALSRIAIVSRGIAAEIIQSDARASELLSEIQAFGEAAVQIIDGELTPEDVEELTELTVQIAPTARQLSLRGVQIGAERTEARRNEFAANLRNTGIVAIVVIAALAVSLIVLNRLFLDAKKKDKDLRASSKRLETTIDRSFDAIITSNSSGEILDFNPAAEKIFDWRKKDLAGLHVGILLPDWSPTLSDIKKNEKTNAFATYLGDGRVEIIARRRTGLVFPADVTVTEAGDASGDLIVIYLRDISDQKLSERVLIEAKEKAERTDKAKSQFLTIMSHEMRTPLNGILGILELLRTTRLSEKQVRYLDVAVASSEILMRQLNEALDMTRIETGGLKLAPYPFDLREEITRIASVLEPLASEKGVSLSLTIQPGMQSVFMADGNRVGQIITNLVGNAVKYTDQGSVDIVCSGATERDRTRVSISVRDTGIGIPADQQQDIFNDYVALSHSSGRMSRSDGLGLAISRRTARMMDGDITVVSVEGEGSVFTLSLPLAHAMAESLGTGSEPSEVNGTAIAFPVSHVLIIEDNAVNRNVLREMLERMGLSVSVAIDGEEGFDVAMRERFDLIFMDINMPSLDGIELTKKIRASDGPNKESPIHGLTAYGEEEYLDVAKGAGMSGFSTKPIRLQDLAQILGRDRSTSGADVSGGGDLDRIVFDELHNALGHVRFQKNLRDFFAEADAALSEMVGSDFLDDIPILQSRLHKLNGAAALFGLKSISERVGEIDELLQADSDEPLDRKFRQLRQHCVETRARVSELVSNEEH